MSKPYIPRSTVQAEIDSYCSLGIRVYEVPKTDFLNYVLAPANGEHFCAPNGWKIAGLYTPRYQTWGKRFELWLRSIIQGYLPGRRIVIRDDLPDWQTFTVLLHERGHDLCAESKCECHHPWNPVLSEIHAQAYALSILLQRKLWNLLRKELEEARKEAKTSGIHGQAAQAIKQSALWRTCIKTVYNNQLGETKHGYQCHNSLRSQ